MTVLTEGRHTGEFLVSEANGYRSRDTVMITGTDHLEAGTVLGQITDTKQYAMLDPDATDGTAVALAVLYAATDTSRGDRRAVAICRSAEVKAGDLVFADGVDSAQQQAALSQLTERGIVPR